MRTSENSAKTTFETFPFHATAVNKDAVREVEFHSCLSLMHGAQG